MICITGAESSLAALARRLEANPSDLHEVRLDRLEVLGDDVFALMEREAGRLVVTCRPRREGGGFRGDEHARFAVLRRAHDLGVRWLDVEHDVDSTPFDRARLIVSEHHFEGPFDASAWATRWKARHGRAALVKLAVAVRDAADLVPLFEARRSIEGEAIVIGMGSAGLVSRARPRAFGSRWSYVAASAETITAPGQLDLTTWAHQGLDDQEAPFCALVGGPQVLASPGPTIYPALFRRRALAARSYLPVVTASLAHTLPLLEALGAVGLSVTMPLKAEAAKLAAGDALVSRLGAANSLRRRGGWEATNTDVIGIERPLAPLVQEGWRALVLGAGGAAAAAVEATLRLGLEVAVSARRADRAAALAARFETVATVPWGDRARSGPDLLVNATPLSGEASPWPEGAPAAPLAFDLAFGEDSRLSHQCDRYLDALAMWRAQGAAQIGWIFDAEIAPSEVMA
jgi:3-dehydroquinate dehydratase type I